MTLITVKDYCETRGVSRQFVYDYIRKGKFKTVELPLFIRYNGVEQYVEAQKFIEVDDEGMEQKIYARTTAKKVTNDSELSKAIEKMLLMDDAAGLAFKTQLSQTYAIPHPKAKALENAFSELHKMLLEEMKSIENSLAALEL